MFTNKFLTRYSLLSSMMNAFCDITFIVIACISFTCTSNFTESSLENETYAAAESTNESFYSYDLNDTFSLHETDIFLNDTEYTTQGLEPSKANELAPEWTDDTANHIKDEGLCTCDLISGDCEVNCCCDIDCDEEDMKVFTKCISQHIDVDPKYCYRENIFFKNNTVYKGYVDPDSQLFCIVHDNFKQRFQFNEVPAYDTVKDFQELYHTNAFSWKLQDENIAFSDKLKAGDMLFRKSSSGYIQPWSMLSHCFSKACDCHQPIAYLEDATSSCLMIIGNLEAECETNTMLSAEHYVNFCIENLVEPVNTSHLTSLENTEEFNQTEEAESNKYIQNDNSNCLTQNNFNKPSFNKKSGSCSNIISSVQYVVIHTGISGIQSINVKFEFGSFDSANSTFFQKFSVVFQWNDTNIGNIVKRSGNPGYQVGLPLIAGRRFNATDKIVDDAFVKIVKSGLTVLNSHTSGTCGGERETLNYGQNLQTGCVFKTMIQSCQKTQEKILNILLGSSERANFVASFGNPNINKSKDWIEIFYDGSNPNDRKPINPENSNECNLILGTNIDIAFAAAGTSANPQFKIIGVVLRYHSKVPICCASSESHLRLSTSVNFFDVSELAVPVFKNIPVFKAKLPQDFFYPFLLSSAYSLHYNYILKTLLLTWPLIICVHSYIYMSG